MDTKMLIMWFLQLFIISSAAQKLNFKPNSTYRICEGAVSSSLKTLHENLKDCVVVLGTLQISVLEHTTKEHFKNISFPKLREVTGYFLVYRVQGLESLGSLFPNLARIRGEQLYNNYALIVFDMARLIEIGLYSLVKIDRGAVMLDNLPQACYMDTVNWKTIAPRSRHVIGSSSSQVSLCNNICTCSTNINVNYCWNNMKCQRFLDGAEGETCNDQCLGCRKTNSDECSVCRYYTYKGECMSRCPNETLVLKSNQYCITVGECKKLGGWAWNTSCVFECPVDYVVQNSSKGTTCKLCTGCYQTCPDQVIQTTSAIEAAERCVYINGSLVIHIRMIADTMEILRTYLSRIQEVSDYVLVYGSNTITSLDFLSSLRHIKGKKLKNDKYSLIIYNMVNLHTIFGPKVTEHLKIGRGTLKVYKNPMLCMSQIDKLKPLFPEQPNEKDILVGTNGYSGSCEELPINIQVRLLNETSVVIMFLPVGDSDVHYSILYVRLPASFNGSVVPETCSESEWFVANVPTSFGHNGAVQLVSLRPASTYAFCIEIYDSVHQQISRTSIFNFTTPVGIPEPPFFVELVASSFDVVVIRWVDHKDYIPHITRYELDIFLIPSNDAVFVDYCKYAMIDYTNVDYTRHAIVMRPPPEYRKTCETMCGILSSYTAGALVEEYFDICSVLGSDCTSQIDIPPLNSSFGKYVGTLALNISSPRDAFQVGNLAPFRDYRFRLRACIGNVCSRSARGVVRTLRSPKADVPILNSASADTAGHIVVKWEPPEVTNGVILAYTVEVLPKLKISALVLPQAWCILANTTNFMATSVIAAKYRVRVCTTTLASVNACCDWLAIEATKNESISWWWMGFIFGFLLYFVSIAVSCLWKSRDSRSDLDPLVEDIPISNCESDPPTLLVSDLIPLSILSLNKSHLQEGIYSINNN